ncbi:MAG: hypothetical protein D6689_03755, partial [Deltaproteobacteria bacterium]
RWPRLSLLCAQCRVALAEGELCDRDGKHPVVRLADARGVEDLRAHVWGPIEVRRALVRAQRQARTRRAARLANAMAAGAVVLAGTTALFVFATPLIAAVGFGGGVFAAAAFQRARGLVHRSRRWPVRPRGARARPAGDPRDPVVAGTVTATAGRAQPPPFGGPMCVAYGLWTWAAGELTYCEQVTVGFDLAADDGRRIRIPPGRCRIEPPPAPAAARWTVVRYVAGRTPSHAAGAPFEPIPIDRFAVAAVRPGDRIAVRARLRDVPDPTAPASGYRDRPATVERADTVPTLLRSRA